MVLRGAGDARTPLLFSLLAVAIDIALNPLLMFGVGPLPRMGIAGSAAATVVANAIGMAASSMAAQNVGAGRWERVGRVALAGVLCNFLLTGGLAIVIYLLDDRALGLFLTDPAAIAIGVHLNAIGVWSFSFFGVSMVLSGGVRSTGAVLPPLAILAVSLLGLRLPFAALLLDRWHEDAIWWSFPVGALASMVMSALYYRLGGWRQARMLA